MKIQIGNWKIETPAKLLIVSIMLVVLAALYFATANFQSLELSGSFSLHARPSCPSFPSVKKGINQP
jgi:hypothetical protein